MSIAIRVRAAVVALLSVMTLAGTAVAEGTGRWIGQDGHDLVGMSAQPGKSDVQDMHFVLAGLPARSKVVSAVVHAAGDGEWKFNGPPNSWLALIVKAPGASTADVYLEPYKPEKGRSFEFKLTYDDGRSETIYVQGGKADHNLRMPGARMEAKWLGQDGSDRAAMSPNVGPDGVQDVRISLARLAPKDEVRSILIAGPGDSRWQFGPNHEAHNGAEFARNPADPTRADLFFHPIRDLGGQSLKLTLTYANGKVDAATVVAGKCDPNLKARPVAVPSVTMLAVKSRWVGQGGGASPGDVRVELDGLPASGRVVSASLSDGVVGGWADRAGDAIPEAMPMTFRPGADASKAELSFPPIRDESGATMTLRLMFTDGRSAVATFPGGACDPSLRAPVPEASSVRAKPGDDLNDLANRHGTVTLDAGTYTMARPLVLNRPVTITSDGGATLAFNQGPGEPAWTAAIKIHAGRTTLDRLAIRFAGPVRWDGDVSYGPAVIGTTDNRDRPTGNVLAGLRFTRLDVEGPPPSTSWEEAPRLLRLVGATNGVIEGNIFKGGLIEFWGGPWRVVDNRQDGTHARSFAHALIGAHDPHDLLVARNRVRPVDPGGKTWRWLVMTNRGANVRVADNVLNGVGARDDDKVEHPNATETILTESYKLSFEGKTSGTSTDGLIVTIPGLQGNPPGVGSILSILSGPQAGQWRRVVMPLGPNAYLLDRPVALGGGAIAIAPGFVEASFENNAIDARGSKIAKPFVLAGHHFGTRLVGNHTWGGSESVLVFASASESPVHWGWSHNPMFGLTFEGNTFEDAWDGAHLAVEHNHLVRASRGRVYFTATLTSNTFIWSDAFLSSYASAHRGAAPAALVLGWKPSGDPGEMVITETGNRRKGGKPGPSAKVHMATVNRRAITEGILPFSSESSGGSH
jgi:hypothetical protein